MDEDAKQAEFDVARAFVSFLDRRGRFARFLKLGRAPRNEKNDRVRGWLALFFALFWTAKQFRFGGIAMAQINVESPVLDWLKHNVSFWAYFFVPCFFALSSLCGM